MSKRNKEKSSRHFRCVLVYLLICLFVYKPSYFKKKQKNKTTTKKTFLHSLKHTKRCVISGCGVSVRMRKRRMRMRLCSYRLRVRDNLSGGANLVGVQAENRWGEAQRKNSRCPHGEESRAEGSFSAELERTFPDVLKTAVSLLRQTALWTHVKTEWFI